MPKESASKWFIDFGWYQENDRSFTFLARGLLCPKCHKRLKIKNETPPETITANIKNCCSKGSDFISSSSPVIESVFRILLANDNQPLDAEELIKELNERRGFACFITPEGLSRLLLTDSYYGIKP